MKKTTFLCMLVAALLTQGGCVLDLLNSYGGGYGSLPFQENYDTDGCYSNWATDVYVCNGDISW